MKREGMMGRPLSGDLRQRVIAAIEGGLSTRAAARRFSIGIATAGAWYRSYRQTGSVHPRKQGQPSGSKLDAHEAFILKLVLEQKDITLAEIAGQLRDERGVQACVGTVWKFFDRRGMTYKKRQRMLASKTAPM
jgi:transposase